MTNRQMVMIKLIQMSDDEFAEFMNDEITDLMEGDLCKYCMEKHCGECPMETGEWEDCMFDMVEWLKKQAS